MSESGVLENNQYTVLGENSVQLVLYMLPLNVDMKLHAPYIIRLQKWTAVVPIIAKADTYSGLNAKMAKQAFLQRSVEAGIEWFNIKKPLKELLPAISIEMSQSTLGACPPFWVITANKGHISTNRQVLYRETSRGTYFVDDPSVSDCRILYTISGGGLQPALVKHYERLHRSREEQALRQAGRNEFLVKLSWIIGITGTVGGLVYLLKDVIADKKIT